MTRAQAQWLLLGVSLLAALGWPVTKIGIQYFEPMTFMGLRFLAVGVLLLPWALPGFAWPAFRDSCIIGLTMIASTTLWVIAVDSAEDLGLAGFVIAMGMVLSPLYSHFLYGERVDRRFWIRLAITAAGGLLMVSEFKLDNFLLFVGAAALFGWQITLISHQGKSHNTVTVGFGQMVTIGVGLLALGIVFEDPSHLRDVSVEGWQWLIFAGIGLTAARFLLQIKAQRHVSHQDASFLLNLESVFVLAVTWWWFDEQHGLWALAGAAFVFVGAAWPIRARQITPTKKPA